MHACSRKAQTPAHASVAQCPAKFFKLAAMWHWKLQVSDSFLLFLGLSHGLRFEFIPAECVSHRAAQRLRGRMGWRGGGGGVRKIKSNSLKLQQ